MRLLALSVLVVAAASCGHPEYPASSAHPLLGQRLPEIHRRTTLDGQPLDTAALSRKPVMVKFFADYCKPCKDTLPAVERVHVDHPEMALVGVDEDDSVETAVSVVQHYGLRFPVIHDKDNVLAGRFRVTSMPMTFVADESGIIRWVGGEGQTEGDLRRAVEAAR